MGRVLVWLWPRARANFIITSHRSWHHNTQKPREGFVIFSQDTDVSSISQKSLGEGFKYFVLEKDGKMGRLLKL